jgi:hypothetical protein
MDIQGGKKELMANGERISEGIARELMFENHQLRCELRKYHWDSSLELSL